MGRADINAVLELESYTLNPNMVNFVHQLYGLLVNASNRYLPSISEVIQLVQSGKEGGQELCQGKESSQSRSSRHHAGMYAAGDDYGEQR